MTMKMRLDTEGLRALIASNPELEVEIGKEVMNNIKADVVKLKTEAAVEACLQGMMTKTGSYYNYSYVAKDPKLVGAISQVVNQLAEGALEQRIESIVTQKVNAEVTRQREELKAHLVHGLRELLTPEMAKELIKEKLML